MGETDVRAAEMQPIGDPHAAALLQQIAEMGISPEQAAEEIRRLRMSRQDRREARRASLNDTIQNEIGGIFGRLGISHRGRTLDPRRVQPNYVWAVSELNRRVNASVEGGGGDRQNFTLDQVDAAHDRLPALVQAFEEELRNGAS